MGEVERVVQKSAVPETLPAVDEERPQRWARWLLMILGVLATLLGLLGMVLPLLPTTPFLLLASACFVRSSPRLHCWLMNNRLCGRLLCDYQAGKGLTLRAMCVLLVLLWLSLGYTTYSLVPNEYYWARWGLVVVGAFISLHLVRQKMHRV